MRYSLLCIVVSNSLLSSLILERQFLCLRSQGIFFIMVNQPLHRSFCSASRRICVTWNSPFTNATCDFFSQCNRNFVFDELVVVLLSGYRRLGWFWPGLICKLQSMEIVAALEKSTVKFNDVNVQESVAVFERIMD